MNNTTKQQLPFPFVENNKEIPYNKWLDNYNTEISQMNNIIINTLKNIEKSGHFSFDYNKLIKDYNRLLYQKSFNKKKNYGK